MDLINKQLAEDDMGSVSGGKKGTNLSPEAKEYVKTLTQTLKKYTPNKNEVTAGKRSILQNYDLLNDDIDGEEEDDDSEDDF